MIRSIPSRFPPLRRCARTRLRARSISLRRCRPPPRDRRRRRGGQHPPHPPQALPRGAGADARRRFVRRDGAVAEVATRFGDPLRRSGSGVVAVHRPLPGAHAEPSLPASSSALRTVPRSNWAKAKVAASSQVRRRGHGVAEPGAEAAAGEGSRRRRVGVKTCGRGPDPTAGAPRRGSAHPRCPARRGRGGRRIPLPAGDRWG